MRALVTGGTGFVGSNLTAGLTRRGVTVRVLRREHSSLTALDQLSYESVSGDILGGQPALIAAMRDCDWVFHVAAVSDYWRSTDTARLYRTNIDGTRNVLSAAQKAGVNRVVFTSSVAALGVPAPGQLLDESCQFNLKPSQFPYGHSKYLAELEVQKAVDAGMQAVILNPTVILGARDVNRIGGSLILEAARGRLRVVPPGGVNFIAVEDVVAGHVAAAERGRSGERYILAGENLSYRTAAAVVCEITGHPAPALTIPAWLLPVVGIGVTAVRAVWGNRVPVDANQVRLSGATIYVDGSKANRELELPHTSFTTAVRSAYDWYRHNGHLRMA